MKENYDYIYYLKFFFCICVIGIHAQIFYNFNNTFDYVVFHSVFRSAVPFFFVASTFFLGLKLKNKSLDDKNIIINKYLIRLIIPYIFWMVVSSIKVISMLDGGLLVKIIKLIRVALFNPWSALWYIWALIVFLIIYKVLINIFKDKFNINVLLVISLVLYLIALLCNNYYFLIENTFMNKIINTYMNIFITPRNGILISIFMVLGLKLSDIKDKFNNKNKLIISSIILFIILVIETLLIRNNSFLDDRSLYITFIIFIPILFILFTKFKSNKNTTLIRNLSTGLYFMHCPTLMLLKLFLVNEYALFISAIVIDTIILLVLYKINNKYINYVIK